MNQSPIIVLSEVRSISGTHKEPTNYNVVLCGRMLQLIRKLIRFDPPHGGLSHPLFCNYSLQSQMESCATLSLQTIVAVATVQQLH